MKKKLIIAAIAAAAGVIVWDEIAIVYNRHLMKEMKKDHNLKVNLMADEMTWMYNRLTSEEKEQFDAIMEQDQAFYKIV